VQAQRKPTYDFRAPSSAPGKQRWERDGIYRARDDDPRPKYYVLEMLPYPSGDLHVGHAKNYTLGDASRACSACAATTSCTRWAGTRSGCRRRTRRSQRGIDPETWTRDNIENMRRQIRLMGTGYDWTREFATCDPVVLPLEPVVLLAHVRARPRLQARGAGQLVPVDQTVLANEQVEDGRCWRCGRWSSGATSRSGSSRSPTTPIVCWRIDTLDGWPERIRTMQRNWIGRSEGDDVLVRRRKLDARSTSTRRASTRSSARRSGARARASARRARSSNASRTARARSKSSRRRCAARSELERTQPDGKTGVPTGAYAINPLSRERIPIWVTNYVLAEYGTGAVMGVPAHDERDFEFAQKHGCRSRGDRRRRRLAAGAAARSLRRRRQADRERRVHRDEVGRARRAITARLEAIGRGAAPSVTASATG
jgi:leucyl-tRNA synthetase